jgi:putative addiction module antidote
MPGVPVTKETTIRAIGNSAGATIPKAMLERYRISEGDRVHLIETEDGILITPFDPTFADAMAVYEEGAKKYRNAMRELAR